MHICFVDILLPYFLMDGLVNNLIFEVGHLHIHFGMFGARVRYDCWNIWVGEGSRCLGHDDWFTAIAVGCPKVMLQLLHSNDKLV